MPCPFATTVQLLYGKVGDAIALTATAPLERLTVILQVSDDHDGVVSTWNRLVSPGIGALWQGNTVSKIYASMAQTITLKVKDYVWANHRTWFLKPAGKGEKASKDSESKAEKESKKEEEYVAQTKATLLAGCVSLAILYPLNYTVTNLLAAGEAKSNATVPLQGFGVRDIVENAVKAGGILTLYRGMGMALAGMVSQQGSYLVLYQRFVLKLGTKKTSENDITKKSDAKESFWNTAKGKFAAEMLVSCIACCLSFPYDTMSRRLQLSDPSVPVSPSLMKDVSGDLYNVGLLPSLLRTILMNSFMKAYTSEAATDFVRNMFNKLHHN